MHRATPNRDRLMIESMRIALVHSFYSSRQPSGENVSVLAELGALRRAGHEAELFSARTDQLERSVLYAPTTALRVATGVGRAPINALRDFAPDLVHVHNLFPNFGRNWVRNIVVPLVATLHNYRPLCANALLFRDGHVCTLCPSGKPWSGVRYGCYRGSHFATVPVAWANRRGERGNALLQRADRLITPSELARDIYANFGIPESKLAVWPHFLPDESDPGPTNEANPSAWLYVGRLSAEKGVTQLVNMWPRNHRLWIVGDGPDRSQVSVASKGKPIELLGPREHGDVLRLMQKSLGVIFPSRCWETFGRAYLEALATGLPVIAFEPNVVADFVRRDETGFVASWDQDLSLVLERAIERLTHFRSRCRAVFEERYREDAHVSRAEALYRALLAAR